VSPKPRRHGGNCAGASKALPLPLFPTAARGHRRAKPGRRRRHRGFFPGGASFHVAVVTSSSTSATTRCCGPLQWARCDDGGRGGGQPGGGSPVTATCRSGSGLGLGPRRAYGSTYVKHISNKATPSGPI
jgi:hypothetical protein